MKYLELNFNITPYGSDAADILTALASEAGLESFVYADHGVVGYVQSRLFDPQALDDALSEFPMPGVTVTYTMHEAEDRDWNEEWEKHGLKPVQLADKISIHTPEQCCPKGTVYDILIAPQQAFGTGNHETTSMILERLLCTDIGGLDVLDAGCGTGILGIFCTMKGARYVFAYDIDNWSVQNTQKNIRWNKIKGMEVEEGDATLLQGKKAFDLILANINRNILLNDLPAFVSVMHEGSRMVLSGFYSEDAPLVIQKAQSFGLTYLDRTEKRDLVTLLFQQ
ncbi:MAG: 50S ribosomal protein L11 methyltransferase [Paraprevotella sp.]|nr:50S ribosomal protein L11 methyltransferase [Paraprevotella sp.]